MIDVNTAGTVQVLTLSSGPVNAQDVELLEELASKPGERLDERKLFEDSRQIQEMYHDGGFHRAIVKNVPTIDEQAGRGSVTFEVMENPD